MPIFLIFIFAVLILVASFITIFMLFIVIVLFVIVRDLTRTNCVVLPARSPDVNTSAGWVLGLFSLECLCP